MLYSKIDRKYFHLFWVWVYWFCGIFLSKLYF